MIINFSITNYRSIRDKVTLSFLPYKSFKELPANSYKATDRIDLLRTAVIYGANASGKSNVLKALNDFFAFILKSTDLKLNQKIEIYEPFLLDTECEHTPTSFEIDFIASDQVRYKYAIEFNSEAIIKEELLCYPKGQKVIVFSRSKSKPIEFGTYLKGEKKSVEARLMNNQLFLTKGANENIEQLIPVYEYFT